jgi:prepilin-type N-terminal cleavage/methylation domain-containing protein
MSGTERLESNKGFTLIEIVTVIVVLGILSVFTFSFIDSAIKTYMIGSKQRMLYQEAANIMERMTRELRDARSVSLPSAGRLRLTRSNTISGVIMDHSSNIDFFQSGANLIRSSDADRIIGVKVDQFIPSISGDCNTSACIVSVTLILRDSSIPVSDLSAKSVTLRSNVTPKNLILGFSGRSFNDDYYDVIQ